VFNLLAEEVATRTAIHLKADKLIFLGKQHGLLNEHGSCNAKFHHTSSMHKLRNTKIRIQTLRYIYAVPKSLDAGVHRVHLISYAYDGALVEELFTRDGSGTMITDAHYEEVRMAAIQDVGGLILPSHALEERHFGLSLT
jgi:amino-acid N-acetyltransferase